MPNSPASGGAGGLDASMESAAGKGGGDSSTSWDGSFDGNWGDAWSTCDGVVDPGPPPDGTPTCPEDLHLPGCPCNLKGQTVPCWTGERRNRNRGICRDGTATCKSLGELGYMWGNCEGEVLPTPGATAGQEACLCFTEAEWRIENPQPCLWSPPTLVAAMSTVPAGDSGVSFACPPKPEAEACVANKTPPGSPWSRNWLTVDCAGVFNLCYSVKAGQVDNPLPTDCVLAKVCVKAVYTTAGKEQQLPDLPSWITLDSTCVNSAWNTGGYSEQWVEGLSVECDPVPKHLLSRKKYCSPKCALPENQGLIECAGC